MSAAFKRDRCGDFQSGVPFHVAIPASWIPAQKRQTTLNPFGVSTTSQPAPAPTQSADLCKHCDSDLTSAYQNVVRAAPKKAAS